MKLPIIIFSISLFIFPAFAAEKNDVVLNSCLMVLEVDIVERAAQSSSSTEWLKRVSKEQSLERFKDVFLDACGREYEPAKNILASGNYDKQLLERSLAVKNERIYTMLSAIQALRDSEEMTEDEIRNFIEEYTAFSYQYILGKKSWEDLLNSYISGNYQLFGI